MTYTKLFGFGLILTVVLVIVKTILFGWFAWADSLMLHLFYWILVDVLSVALVRRLGVITLLESLIVVVLWLFLELMGDILVSGPVAGFAVLVDANFAVGYVVLVAGMLLFHKKRHVQRRRDLGA